MLQAWSMTIMINQSSTEGQSVSRTKVMINRGNFLPIQTTKVYPYFITCSATLVMITLCQTSSSNRITLLRIPVSNRPFPMLMDKETAPSFMAKLR